MTQDRLWNFVSAVGLVVVAAVWLWFLFALRRTHFQAVNERKTNAAAADSKLVAVDRGARLCRHCSGRRAGSHWLDCTGTIGILGGERCDWSACFEKRPETALQSSDLHAKSPDQLKCVIAVRPRWKLASGRQ